MSKPRRHTKKTALFDLSLWISVLLIAATITLVAIVRVRIVEHLASTEPIPEFSIKNWQFDEAHNLYYQLATLYMRGEEPASYRTFNIYSPAKYLDCEPAGSKYVCYPSDSVAHDLDLYRASTAPIKLLVPSLTPASLSAQEAYNYNSVAACVKAGYVCIRPGYYIPEENLEAFGGEFVLANFETLTNFLHKFSSLVPGDLKNIELLTLEEPEEEEETKEEQKEEETEETEGGEANVLSSEGTESSQEDSSELEKATDL